MLPSDLAQEWLETASVFRQHEEPSVAVAYERCASQLTEALEAEDRTLLTLQQAAEESGYSADHLGRLVREGKIPNTGRPGAPRIRRADLPTKPPPAPSPIAEETPHSETPFAQIVQSIIDEGVA